MSLDLKELYQALELEKLIFDELKESPVRLDYRYEFKHAMMNTRLRSHALRRAINRIEADAK